MRDYLYVWHQPETKRLLLSGVVFADLLPELQGVGGLLLVRHQFDNARRDRHTQSDFVSSDQFPDLVADNIYGYGDFCWADYGAAVELEKLTDRSIAEIAFFRQVLRPLRNVEVGGLQNRFLAYSHDDGWYLRLFYSDWRFVETLVGRMLAKFLDKTTQFEATEKLRKSQMAYWIRQGSIQECEQTEDVDSVHDKYTPKP